MADTAALVVALSAQLTKFERDMKEAAQIAARGANDIETSFNKIQPNFEGIAKGLKAALAGLGVGEIIRRIAELNKEVANIGEAAETVGVSVEQFQQLRFAIVATGGDAEKAEQFLIRFSRAASEAAQGQGDLHEWLKKNNVQFTDQSGNLGSVTDNLAKFADLVKGATAQQDKLNLVIAAGGRDAGPALLSLLNQGSAGLRQFMEEATRAGVVLQTEFVERVKKAEIESNKAWLAMKTPVLEFAVLLRNEVVGGLKSLAEVAKEVSIIIESLFTKGSAGAEAFAETARKRGIEALKRGEGTPLIKSLEGFPGQPPEEPAATKVTVRPDKEAEAFNKLIEAQKRRIELLKVEQDTLGQSLGVQAQARAQVELETAAKAQNIALTPERIAAIQREAAAVGAATDELAKQKFQFQELQSASTELGSALSQAFQGAIIEGQKFDEVLNNLVRRLESKAFDKLFDLAFAPQGASTSSLFTQLLQSLTGKAGGGPVSSGQPYLVGEKGPELFVPSQSGMIVPNKVTARGGQAGDRNLNVSVDVTGANGDKAIEAAVNRGVQRAVQQSVSIVNATAPSRQLRYSQLGT